MKNKQGITLVALVITIIVLLILAGVSIALGVGNNGVITKSAQAELEVNKGDILEQLKIYVSDLYLNMYGTFGTSFRLSANNLVDYFAKSSYTVQGTDFDDGKAIFKDPKDNGSAIATADANKGFIAGDYYYYMIDIDAMGRSMRYGKGSDWTEGDIFMLRRNYTAMSGGTISLGNEFKLVYKRAKGDINNNENNVEIAVVGDIDANNLD